MYKTRLQHNRTLNRNLPRMKPNFREPGLGFTDLGRAWRPRESQVDKGKEPAYSSKESDSTFQPKGEPGQDYS